MKITAISRRTLTALAALAMLGAGSSCVNDNSLCPEDQPGFDKTDVVWLSFNIRNVDNTGGRSRAVVDPDHPDEDALAAESFINCADYDLSVMFLDANGRVMKVFNKDEFAIVASGTDGTYRDYNLTMNINQGYFPPTGDNVTFSLLVVANLKGTGDGSTFGLNWMASVDELSKRQISYGYTGAIAGGTTAWQPDINAKRLIPMAGLRQFTVSRAALSAATDRDKELNLSADGTTIDMQRSMAKIRVVDALAENGNPDAKIVGVTLTGTNTRGAYLPAVEPNSWTPNTAVCHFGMANEGWFDATTVRNSYGLSIDGKNAWGFYITEFARSSAPAASEPVLHITVESGGEQRTYDYPVSKSLGNTDMTRNHIYEFVVTEVSGLKLELTCTVLDWDSQEVEWDYKDNITMAQDGYIKWLNGHVNPPVATVTFDSDLSDLVCRFSFMTPAGFEWKAVLLPQKGNPSAFSFEGPASGTIVPNEVIELRIRTSDLSPRENNTARLQIIVKTPWGNAIDAPVLDGNIYTNDRYFTINQNASL